MEEFMQLETKRENIILNQLIGQKSDLMEVEGDVIVNVQQAVTRLKALRVDIENDSGDIGSSSKIFMQIGSSFGKQKKTDLSNVLDTTKKGSFGATEIMMMLMLLFLSLLCELAINQFSPKTTISRKMLNQFSQYFPADFDINDFMLDIYIEQFNYGAMSKEKFDECVKDTLSMMDINKKKLKENGKKKGYEVITEILKKENYLTAKEVNNLISKVKEDTDKKLQEFVKESEISQLKEEINKFNYKEVAEEMDEPEEPIVENIKPSNKMIVKSAEKEIQEMISEGSK